MCDSETLPRRNGRSAFVLRQRYKIPASDLSKLVKHVWPFFGLNSLHAKKSPLLSLNAVLSYNLITPWHVPLIRIPPQAQPCAPRPRSPGYTSSPYPGPTASAYQTRPPYPSPRSCCHCSNLPLAGKPCTYPPINPTSAFPSSQANTITTTTTTTTLLLLLLPSPPQITQLK